MDECTSVSRNKAGERAKPHVTPPSPEGRAGIAPPQPPAYLSVGRRANLSGPFFPFFEGPMLGALARRLFGSANDRYVKSLGPIVSAINELEPQLEAMSDDELRARTQQFKQQLADGTELDDILIDA